MGGRQRTARSLWMRRAALADGDRLVGCCWCGRRVPLPESTTEHLVPVAWGGGHLPGNTACACAPCNGQRGIVPASYDRMRDLLARAAQWAGLFPWEKEQLLRNAASWNADLPRLLARQRFWAQMEVRKFGRAYSAERELLPVVLPGLQSGRTENAQKESEPQ